MRRGVEVSADMQRHRYLLAAGLVEREPLDPSDRRPGVAGECRRVQGEVLREVEESHLVKPGRGAAASKRQRRQLETLPQAAREPCAALASLVCLRRPRLKT